MKNKINSKNRAKNVYTGPGHHWKKLTQEERSAIGQRAAESRRLNSAARLEKKLLGHVDLLERLALKAGGMEVSTVASELRQFITA